MPDIRVTVAGAAGKMGRETVRAVIGTEGFVLSGAVDIAPVGEDAAAVAGLKPVGIRIQPDLRQVLETGTDVLVDFTSPKTVLSNLHVAIRAGIPTVVGTTGLTSVDLEEADKLCRAKKVPVVVAPNFAVGAVLMMHCAAIAARYFHHSEIIELHHDQKLDAPSGTAIKTAEMMLAARTDSPPVEPELIEKVSGVRGGEIGGIHMHSVRLPGLIAHQEVIFGGMGQTLTIRHDSISRESFMPGVLLAIRRIREFEGLVYGLEKLLGLTP